MTWRSQCQGFTVALDRLVDRNDISGLTMVNQQTVSQPLGMRISVRVALRTGSKSRALIPDILE
jgi:hypothetical protein